MNIACSDLITFFSTIECFKDLTSQNINDFVIPLLTIETFFKNQLIMQKGTYGNSIYIIYEGDVVVEVQRNNELLYFDMPKGSILGEMALVFHDSLRTANVVATNNVTSLSIDIETLEMVLKTEVEFTRVFARFIGKRLASR
jgi:CRP-like cAMP-binding protein